MMQLGRGSLGTERVKQGGVCSWRHDGKGDGGVKIGRRVKRGRIKGIESNETGNPVEKSSGKVGDESEGEKKKT